MVPIVLVFIVGTFGLNFQITLALVAKQVFGLGAGSYGALSSMLALGSLLGALGSARRSGPPSQRLLIGAGLTFGVLEVVVGLAPSYWLMAALLVPTGAAVLTFTTTANATVQLGSTPEMRGRVMAIYVLVFLGGTPVGAPVIGALAEGLGARSSLLIGGAVSALSCALAGYSLRRRSSGGTNQSTPVDTPNATAIDVASADANSTSLTKSSTAAMVSSSSTVPTTA
jgi:MFS family permease